MTQPTDDEARRTRPFAGPAAVTPAELARKVGQAVRGGAR
jgi:hypothetical protein